MYVSFGNTAGRGRDVVLGRRQRGKKGDKAFNPRTGAGYVSPIAGDYARAQACGVTCVPLLNDTFGGLSPALYGVLRTAAESRRKVSGVAGGVYICAEFVNQKICLFRTGEYKPCAGRLCTLKSSHTHELNGDRVPRAHNQVQASVALGV